MSRDFFFSLLLYSWLSFFHFFAVEFFLSNEIRERAVPQPFAVRTNAIVFVVNYRLNIHGFLATSAMVAEQGGFAGNYGFMVI